MFSVHKKCANPTDLADDQLRSLRCPRCSTSFSRKDTLVRHIQKNRRRGPRACEAQVPETAAPDLPGSPAPPPPPAAR
eukprot:2285996-Pyramimonas_sp.AAC.1